MRARTVSLRVWLCADTFLGPGKADLLQGVRETGSISGAGRRMGMSYKRAWYLIDTLNRAFREPLVAASKGGKAGGGAQLTASGMAVLDAYRRVEEAAAVAAVDDLAKLENLLKPQGE